MGKQSQLRDEDIFQILETVQDEGRDIVSAGMVQGVQVWMPTKADFSSPQKDIS